MSRKVIFDLPDCVFEQLDAEAKHKEIARSHVIKNLLFERFLPKGDRHES